MKKIISFFMALLMLATTLPAGVMYAFAADNAKATISVESTSAAVDSYVDVAVNILENPGIASMGVTLSFDEDLTLVGATNGDAFSELTMTPPAQLKKTGSVSGSCRFAWLGSDNCTETGTILNLRFKVSENATLYKECKILISSEVGDVLDNSRNPITLNVATGKVTIIDYIPGDVDGSGFINMFDVLTLCQYYVDGCKYDPEGYAVDIIPESGDVDANGKINMLDVLMLCQYYVDGCKYDPNGYGVKLLPGKRSCNHNLQHFAAVPATCTEDGNIEHWYCNLCNDCFADADAKDVISLDYVVIKAEGHTVVVDEAVAPTYTSTGLTEGSHCSECNTILKKQDIIPILKSDEYSITYYISNDDTYLQSLDFNNPNETSYTSENGYVLKNLTIPGYKFQGWYNESGTRIYEISKGTTGDIVLFARLTEEVYDVTYRMYRTPLKPITEDKYLHYNVSKGMVEMPNPEINNYVFLGWYTDDGKEVTEIPSGTIGDLTLNAYWVSKRNLTKAVSNIEDPIILEDSDNGVIYFTYELGTIENVPVSDAIWTIQSVSGLAQQRSETISTTISSEQAEKVCETVSNSTVDSGTWTLSEDWNDSTQINETWAEQNGMTKEEAETIGKTSSNTYSLTTSAGGSSSTTHNSGTTTLEYNSRNDTAENKKGSSKELDVTVGGSYSAEAGVSTPVASGKAGYEIHGEVEAGYKRQNEDSKGSNVHSGSDTTSVDTTVSASSSTWNNSSSSSRTQTDSRSRTVSNSISQIITNTKGYGHSYSSGGASSESKGFSNSASKSVDTASTLTYCTSETKTTTSTYSTDGHIEGCYRLVIAGTIHVFGVVGYDVATKSYFTYTYNVMDDETHEFLDYSPNLNFDDYEYGVLPFEIPYSVAEYVDSRTVKTEGLQFRTNSANKTATVLDYTGSSTDVIIPSYISSGNTSYKVTAISPNAFAGKNIRSIILSRFISEIPDSAFKNCTILENVYGTFNKIGNEAFSGCIALGNFNIAAQTTYIGTNAFKDVPKLTVKVLNDVAALNEAKKLNPTASNEELSEKAKDLTQEFINSAINSGADNVVLDISSVIEDVELTISVPEIDSFELQGGDRIYNNLKLVSKANETVIKELRSYGCKRIPFEISSQKVTLEAVIVEGDSFILMLPEDNVNINLIRDTRLTSIVGNAIVCKNPKIASQLTDATVGVMDVSGNVYVCGSVSGLSYVNVANGDIIYISESDFEKYIKGFYNITFDANGGSVSEMERTMYYGQNIGELPTAKKDYNYLVGWFTDPVEGVQVFDSTVPDNTGNITLYAHWVENEISGWVKASEIPNEADVVNRKYSYTLRTYTESGSSSLSGWTKYDTKRTSWGSKQGPVYSNPSNGTRNVTSEQYVKSTTTHYKYYHRWNGSGTWGSDSTAPKWAKHEIDLTYSLGNSGVSSSYGITWKGSYACPTCGAKNMWIANGTYTTNNYATRWYYQEPVYTYYYYKDENKESASNPTGQSNVSNVQEWVQYRVK